MHYSDLDLHHLPKVEIRESYQQPQECGYLLAKTQLKKGLEKDNHAASVRLLKKIERNHTELHSLVGSLKGKIAGKSYRELLLHMEFIRGVHAEIFKLTSTSEYKYLCPAEKKKCIELLGIMLKRLEGAIDTGRRESTVVEDYVEKFENQIVLLERSICHAKAFIYTCVNKITHTHVY